MMTMLAHFVYMDTYGRMMSNYYTCALRSLGLVRCLVVEISPKVFTLRNVPLSQDTFLKVKVFR